MIVDDGVHRYRGVHPLQIPDYRNAVIVARNPNAVKRAMSYAERLRLPIAVIHGEERCPESEEDDGRNSPPIEGARVSSLACSSSGLRILPRKDRACVGVMFQCLICDVIYGPGCDVVVWVVTL